MKRRRFCSALLCVLLALLLCLSGTALAEKPDETPAIDTSALTAYVDQWNTFFLNRGSDYKISCELSEDRSAVSYLYVVFNGSHSAKEYGTDLIPATSGIFVSYQLATNEISFCIFDDALTGNLEKAVFYTDSLVLTPSDTVSNHEGNHFWAVSFPSNMALSFVDESSVTAKLTVDGKTNYVEIDYRAGHSLFDIYTWLRGALAYSRQDSPDYQSANLLPRQAAAVSGGTPTEAPSSGYSFRDDYDAIDRCVQSVFYVDIYDRNKEVIGSASGFVALDDHVFITNYHVIKDAAYLIVWDEKQRSYMLDKVLASDKNKDIAILEFPDGVNYESLPIAEDSQPLRGQPVVTIGSPKGFQNTVAYGNISAFPTMDGITYIQFTAPISHGSSGGALFDDEGRVIGITTAGVEEGENLGFAVPIGLAVDLYKSRVKDPDSQLAGGDDARDAVSDTALGDWVRSQLGGGSASPTPTPVPKETGGSSSGKSSGGTVAERLRGRWKVTALVGQDGDMAENLKLLEAAQGGYYVEFGDGKMTSWMIIYGEESNREDYTYKVEGDILTTGDGSRMSVLFVGESVILTDTTTDETMTLAPAQED